MTSVVTVFQPLQGDRDALERVFTGDPTTWLPALDGQADGRHLVVHAGALSRTVVATVGDPWKAGDTRWRSLSWTPAPDDAERDPLGRVLPALDGELALHLDEGRLTLALEARYEPPGGPLGAAADALALHRIARATVERLLVDIGRGLVRAADETRLVDPDPPAPRPHP